MFHGGELQKLFLATMKVCCVRQLEKTKIACRNDKNLLCALGLTLLRQFVIHYVWRQTPYLVLYSHVVYVANIGGWYLIEGGVKKIKKAFINIVVIIRNNYTSILRKQK